ncbi:MAG: tRNA pseudouridine(38-40) synthase TruA [Candidatus Kapabacteria bacterium]|nr:tRNA pseudouridine(38-40) synthase TruA [Candidatus Kapabacteria bacterium]
MHADGSACRGYPRRTPQERHRSGHHRCRHCDPAAEPANSEGCPVCDARGRDRLCAVRGAAKRTAAVRRGTPACSTHRERTSACRKQMARSAGAGRADPDKRDRRLPRSPRHVRRNRSDGTVCYRCVRKRTTKPDKTGFYLCVMTRHLALLIEYDGTDYAGWQIQPNGMSVQQRIESAMFDAFGVPCGIVGSGRTDSGVHARGQVAHTRVTDGHDIPIAKIPVALNVRLPRDIRIRDAAEVDADFHARFGAIRREYVYVISREASVFHRRFAWKPEIPYDEGLLGNAAREFVGRHDMTTYSKHNHVIENHVCDITTCIVEPESDRLLIRIAADRFVYGMCRCIVGAMMDVARKKLPLHAIAEYREARDRSMQSPIAPAHGLILNRVSYANDVFSHHPSF